MMVACQALEDILTFSEVNNGTEDRQPRAGWGHWVMKLPFRVCEHNN